MSLENTLRPSAKRKSWRPVTILATAAVVAAGTYAFWIVSPLTQAVSAPNSFSGRSLSEAKEQLKLDSGIKGFVGVLVQDNSETIIRGWAVDAAHPDMPLAISAFVSEAVLGDAQVNGSRPDVEESMNLPAGSPAAFRITTGSDCPSGQAVSVLAVSEDGRYAPLSFTQTAKPQCP